MVYWRILCHEKWKTSPLTWYGVDLIGYVNMHGSLAYFPFFCSNSIGAIILSIFKQSHYRWETLFVMHHAWEDIWRKEHFWKCLHRVLHSRKLFDKFEASFPGSREKRAVARVRVQQQTISKFIQIVNHKIVYFLLEQVIDQAVHTCRYLVL